MSTPCRSPKPADMRCSTHLPVPITPCAASQDAGHTRVNWRLGSMARQPPANQPDDMRSLDRPTSSAGLEADNELYDGGCDLVRAAADIRRAAESPEAVRAVPAVL